MSRPLRAGFDLTIAVGPGFIRLYKIVSWFESQSKGERYRFSRFKSIPALLKKCIISIIPCGAKGTTGHY
ncbi:hypothetical protein [Paenibacillus polymyxa]|uniref:hypothetical protein n=1 Tax=Paenibacillus polymyxa TaxID=1406 RepID=UPI001185C3D0|nr:hypothetical protein [Paenibacillus polymyxa]